MAQVRVHITVTNDDGSIVHYEGEALEFNTTQTREMAPIHVMGSADPRQFVRGRTSRSFSCTGLVDKVIVSGDMVEPVEEVHYHRFDFEE